VKNPKELTISGKESLMFVQAGELSENSLISEIFVSTSEKIWLFFLLNAYALFIYLFIYLFHFQRFVNLPIEFSEIFSTLCSPPCKQLLVLIVWELYDHFCGFHGFRGIS
jgi:hypothetical protein